MDWAGFTEWLLTTAFGAVIFFSLWLLFRTRQVPAAGPFHARWRPLESIILTVGIFLFSNILAGVIIGVVLAAQGIKDFASFTDSSTLTNFIYMFLFEIIIVAALLTFIRKRGASVATIGLRKPKIRDVLYALIGFGAYFLMYIGLYLLARRYAPWIDFEQEQELGFNTNVEGVSLALVFISLVVIAPIAEEITCRGFLYSGLRSRLAMIPAAIVTSVIFAAAHLQIGGDAPLLWVAAIDTFTLSMVMVYLREKTDSLASPIFVHMMKNGLAFFALFVAPRLVF